MATGYVHVNGRDYELAYPQTATSVEQVRNQLGGSNDRVLLDVLVADRKQVSLTVRPALVWAMSVWLVEESGPPFA